MVHFALAPPHRRSRLVLALFATLGVAGFADADMPAGGGRSSVDEAMLKMEAPEGAIAAIRAAPMLVAERIASLEGREVPAAVLSAAVKAVNDAYDVPATVDALEAAMMAASGAGDDSRLAGIADHLAGAAQAAATEPEEARRRFTATDDRPDHARIDELAGLMAAPTLAGEVMLAADRMERALDVPHIAGMDKLAGLDASRIATEVDSLVASTRQDAGGRDAGGRNSGGMSEPYSRTRGILEGKARLQAQLLELTEADVEALHAFYSSPTGRAKRDALIGTFIALNDRHAAAMLTAYLNALRTLAP